MSRTIGCCLSNCCSISRIARIEFNHIPPHIFCDGSCNGCFPNPGWSNKKQCFLLWDPCFPIIKPSSDFPSLNFVPFQVLFTFWSVALSPIACATHDFYMVARVHQSSHADSFVFADFSPVWRQSTRVNFRC